MITNRRRFLQRAALLATCGPVVKAGWLGRALAAPQSASQVNAALKRMRGRTMVYSSWGGSFQDAQRAAYLKPFSERYGVRIIEDGPPTNAKVIAMVRSGKVTWDVCSFGAFRIPPLGADGYLEEIDYNVVDARHVIPFLVFKWGLASDTTTTLLSYRSDMVGPDRPTSVRDLWDLKRFPGKRGLNDEPTHCIPFALYALGTPKEQIYPLTPDKILRAFAKLDEIKGEAIWWTIGAQPTQLLADKEVALSIAYNNRFGDAFKDGLPIRFAWDGGQFYGDGWGIPKGAPNKDLAMLFVAWATLPENNAAITRFMDLGPSNLNALQFVDQNRLDRLPNHYIDEAIRMDVNFWGANWDHIVEQWKEWRLKG